MQMQFSGQEQVQAPPAVVWAFVNDPQRVAACLPGVQDVQVVGPGELEVTVPLQAGLLRGSMKARVQIVPDEQGGVVRVGIQGGGLGSQMNVDAGATVVDTGDGQTRLDWQGTAALSGPLAKLGKAMEPRVQGLIARTFRNMSASIAAESRLA
ncbi:CoxG family protein [Deinococcus sp. VB343]|uniref:CoxG family protein n=1 Tax=Deinococcus sp. VB142 TaxID=3112952 RepID=A0AAU6PZ78_9DEIO